MQGRLSDLLRFRSSFRGSNLVALAFCVAAIAFLICGSRVHIVRIRLAVSPLAPLDRREPLLSGTAFAPNAVYPATPLPNLLGSLNLYGSWLGSNTPTGSVHTPWYPPSPSFDYFVSGYPNHPGNRLIAEVVTRHSGTITLDIAPHNEPTESWVWNEISLRNIPDAVKFRIVAVDGSTSFWLGFSEPFLVRGEDTLRLSKQLSLVVLASAASLLFFVAPGLVLRQKLVRSYGRNLPFIWIPVPGLLCMALLGLASWIGPQQLTGRSISQTGLWLLVWYVTYQFLRVPLVSFTSAAERRVLLVVIALTATAVAKATYSVGPVGELFRDQIWRTLEVGARSDSVISYNVVQLAALRQPPFGTLAQSLYQTWNFSHRGPINGLAASPVVLASPVQVPPTVWKVQPWNPFDPEGFSAYRIAMIVMASSSLLVVFGLATLFLPDDWALFAFLVAATAPFVIHELYFTWPKLSSASFVLLAAYLVFRSRYLLGGLSLGIGYLCHPSALVWFPCLVGILVVSHQSPESRAMSIRRRVYSWSLATASTVAGLAICVLLWRLFSGSHFGQGGFLSFVYMTWIFPPTPANWLLSRFDSVCNTLVPLSVFLFDRADPYMNALDAPTPLVIQFFFQYWNALPFGAGIAFFCCGLVPLIYMALSKARAWLLLVFVIPLALFTIYWGASISGMLRENLHAWFLGLMVFAAVIWKKHMAQAQRFWRICSWALLFRGVEVLLMLLLPSIWTQHLLVRREFALGDVVSLLVMLGCTAWLCIYTFKFAEKLRVQSALLAPEDVRIL